MNIEGSWISHLKPNDRQRLSSKNLNLEYVSIFHTFDYAEIVLEVYNIDAFITWIEERKTGQIIAMGCFYPVGVRGVLGLGKELAPHIFGATYQTIQCSRKEYYGTYLNEITTYIKKNVNKSLILIEKIEGIQAPYGGSDKIYGIYIGELKRSYDEYWSTQISSKTRNLVRKAKKFHHQTSIENGDCLEEFYHLYCLQMQRLGAPLHSLDYFQSLNETFKSQIYFSNVRINGKLAASMILTRCGNMLSNPWSIYDWEYRNSLVNYENYAHALAFAHGLGVKQFDFGRSLYNSRNSKFKISFGARGIPLYMLRSETQKIAQPPDAEKMIYTICIAVWRVLPIFILKRISLFFLRIFG